MTTIEEQCWADFDILNIVNKPVYEKVNCYNCPCGGTKLYSSCGLPVCNDCGLVDDNYIDDSPEWTNGVSEDGTVSDQSRCGMPQDLGLFSEAWGTGTVISTGRGSTYAQRKMARINFHGSMNHRDRALFHAYKHIETAAKDVLTLPESVVRDAKIMYRKFNGEILTRGAVRTGIKANCVFWACKVNNVPRTTKEVADAFNIPTKDLSRTSETFKQFLVGKTETPTSPDITKPQHVINRMINEFELDDKRKWRMKCIRCAESLENCIPLMGKTPNSIAAVVIYNVLKDHVSKHDIVNKCGISMPTLNKIEIIVNKHLEDKN